MSWSGQILLSPSTDETQDRGYVDDGDFRFYTDCSFRFNNRVYPYKQALDVDYGCFHIVRGAGSRRLTVECTGGDQVIFECEWTLAGARWIRWTPLAVDAAGSPDPDPRPTRFEANILFVTRQWHNLVGVVTIVLGGAVVVMVLLGVLAILLSACRALVSS